MPPIKPVLNNNNILSALSMPVNTLPTITLCPNCRTNSMWVGRTNDGQLQMYCRSCHYAGDPVAAYCLINSVDNTKAVRDLLAKQQQNASAAEIADFLSNWRVTREIYDSWQQFRTAINHAPGDNTTLEILLDHYGLLTLTNKPSWKRGMGLFVGAATGKQLRKLYPCALDVKRWYLVTPLQTMPGAIVGYLVYDVRRNRELVTVIGNQGVGFMEAANAYLDSLYVCCDALAAIRLHRASQALTGQMPSIVYAETEVGLSNITTGTTYVWHPTDVFSALRLARSLPGNVHVVPAMEPGTQISEQQLKRAAVPWLQMVLQLLIESDDLTAQITLLGELQLNHAEAMSLVQLAPQEHKAAIQRLLQNSLVTNLQVSTNIELIDQNDGWYERNINTGKTALVSEAVPVVTNCIVYQDGSTRMSGYIRCKQSQIPFDNADQKQTVEWLRTTARKAGFYPYVKDCEHTRNALDISMRMYKSPVTKAVNQIGWLKELQLFALPGCPVDTSGNVLDIRCDHRAAFELRKPSADELYQLLNEADAVPVLTGIMTTVLATALCATEPLPILLAHDDACTAAIRAKQLATAAAWQEGYGHHSHYWYKTLNMTQQKRYPVLLRQYHNLKDAQYSLATGINGPLVLPADKYLAAAIACSAEHWLSAEQCILPGQYQWLYPAALIGCLRHGLLKDLCQDDCVALICFYMHAWLHGIGVTETQAVDIAAANLRVVGGKNRLENFLQLLRLLHRDGLLDKAITFTDDTVQVHWAKMTTALADQGLPLLVDDLSVQVWLRTLTKAVVDVHRYRLQSFSLPLSSWTGLNR